MTDFLPFSKGYTPEETERMLATVPEHLTEDIRSLIESVNRAHESIKSYAIPTGRWFHVSPHRLPVGTLLSPGVVAPTSEEFYTRDGYGQDSGTLADMGATRPEHLWLTTTVEDAAFWANVLKAEHTYEVMPVDMPKPWNGTGVDGWVTTAAAILRELT